MTPVFGTPARGVAWLAVSWQPAWVQLLAAVTPLAAWSKVAGNHAEVRWHEEHCDEVLRWLVLAGVHALPV